MKCDAHGRPYAKLDELKPEDMVQVDDGFNCMSGWTKRMVFLDESRNELYILCAMGRHYLDGQDDDGKGYLVGIYREKHDETEA